MKSRVNFNIGVLLLGLLATILLFQGLGLAFTLEGEGSVWSAVVKRPHQSPIFRHWDLREFDDCDIPYTVNPNTNDDINGDGNVNNAADQAAVLAAIDASFASWQGVFPAVIKFHRAPNATAINAIRLDQNNVVFWGLSPVDDVQIIPVGQGQPNTRCIDGGIDGLDPATVAGGDDVVNGNEVNTGANGICETAAQGNDTQEIPVGNGQPGQICVTAGGNGLLEAIPNMDDNRVANIITTGADGIADTRAPIPPANVIALGATFIEAGSGRILEADIWMNDANPGIVWNVGIETPPQYDIQVTATHEIGHFIGLHHADFYDKTKSGSSMAGTLYQPPLTAAQQAHNNAVYPNNIGKRVLAADDNDGCNFLYTPDLGDAPDYDQVYGGMFSTKVHGNVPSRTLNGEQCKAVWPGADHFFGIKKRQVPNYTYEWLGYDVDAECEANVVNLDLFDDGVEISPNPPIPGSPCAIKVTVNTAADADGFAHNYAVDKLWVNTWIDLNLNQSWEESEHIIHQGLAGGGVIIDTIVFPLNTSQDCWLRARVDWGEDVGSVKKYDPTLLLTEGAAQFGEVEDYPFRARFCYTYTSTTDPSDAVPWGLDFPNPWTGITANDQVKFPDDDGDPLWYSRRNLYVPTNRKLWTVELIGPASNKFGIDDVKGYYFKSIVPKVIKEVPVSVVVPPATDIAGPPQKRIFTMLLNPQPDWEVVKLVRTGAKANDSLSINSYSMCSPFDTLTYSSGPALQMGISWFGVADYDDLNITDVWIFPQNQIVNTDVAHVFLADGVWSTVFINQDPFGTWHENGGVWYMVDGSDGLTAGEEFETFVHTFEMPDTLYSIIAFDQISESYQYYYLKIPALVTCQGLCGDVNGDERVNVSDAVYVINYVFSGGNPPQPVVACGDANTDGRVNVSDAVSLINFVFSGGNPPADCAAGSVNWDGQDCCSFEL